MRIVLDRELTRRELKVEWQVPVPINIRILAKHGIARAVDGLQE
jgi:hypothetical protein